LLKSGKISVDESGSAEIAAALYTLSLFKTKIKIYEGHFFPLIRNSETFETLLL
jgi:hypothetical protein